VLLVMTQAHINASRDGEVMACGTREEERAGGGGLVGHETWFVVVARRGRAGTGCVASETKRMGVVDAVDRAGR